MIHISDIVAIIFIIIIPPLAKIASNYFYARQQDRELKKNMSKTFRGRMQ